jgi:hypothetical protein
LDRIKKNSESHPSNAWLKNLRKKNWSRQQFQAGSPYELKGENMPQKGFFRTEKLFAY